MNSVEVNAEQARHRIDINNPDRAVYEWVVKRYPGVNDAALIAESETIIAQYDIFGGLHKLDEIKIKPPYVFGLASPRKRQGVDDRYVIVMPGWSYVYEHRVVERFSAVSASKAFYRKGKLVEIKNADYKPPEMLDCVIFGHQHIATGVCELLVVGPDGRTFGSDNDAHVPFRSIHEARSFVR